MFTLLLDSALVLGIQYFSTQIYETAVDILRKIEKIGIGATRDFINDSKAVIQTLTVQARKSENGFSIISLGYLGGNYAVITPKSQAQFTELVAQFDQEESSRKGHAAFKFFSGKDAFIISDFGHDSQLVRKNLSRFLTPGRLAKPMIEEIEASVMVGTQIPLRYTVSGIVRAVMLGNIMGINHLPDSTYDIMEAYRNDVKRWAAFPFPEILNYIPSLRKKRDSYDAFTKAILEQEFENVVNVIQTHKNPNHDNLIVACIISLYKEDHPTLSEDELTESIKSLSTDEIRKYFDNPIVQSSPMILKAADNLVDAIVLCLEQIATSPEKLEMLENELEESQILASNQLDLTKLRALPVLDAFYKESMRFDSPAMVPRYTTNGFVSDSMTIPPHTMILFDLHALSRGAQYWTNPNEFDPGRFLNDSKALTSDTGDRSSQESSRKLGQFPLVPFSVGLRNCPAFSVTEYLFKAAVAKFVSDYKLEILTKNDKDLILDVSSKDESLESEKGYKRM